ncbi:hypothetical protein [Paraburkholderia sp. SOS3]|uniref:hypothetical protein n=1 Tax=Paraburkholderia sp. SOS3 TaxID=1926494 RepID=UPI0009476E53|nr:hypothetical protein [Paraburkholderia sp. SOS3]APR35220.1 hypothetical protein BTO02_07020 [Paraburkholderia sp. SOS3]
MHDTASDPEAAFRATNVGGILRLAKVAQQQGVSRSALVDRRTSPNTDCAAAAQRAAARRQSRIFDVKK